MQVRVRVRVDRPATAERVNEWRHGAGWRRRAVGWSAGAAVLCLALLAPVPALAQLGTSDPAFWVRLPDGALVPHDHPLALAAGKRPRPALQDSARPTTPQPGHGAGKVLTPADPGFWVRLPDGGIVPYNHPAAAAVQAPAPRAPSGGSTSPSASRPPPQQAPAPAPRPAPAPAPDPAPEATASTSGTTLKVLDWNIQHGVGTDGRYDLDRIATWIVRSGANVVSLNEVEKFTGWGNEDQPARFASLLRSKSGRTWYHHFAQREGGGHGQGNLLLSIFPIESTGEHQLSYARSAARITILVNGTRVNVFSTHLDPDSSARRATQMRELTAWARTYPEQRIIAGDFNAWPGAGEISNMTSSYDDTWAMARAAGTATAFAGNEAGNTRKSRIDYVFCSKGASQLRLGGVRVFDTRDSRGHMPSDHRPVLATFSVR